MNEPIYIPSRVTLNRVNRDGGKLVEAKKIMAVVELFFDTTIEKIVGKCRKKEILYPRQVAMYMLAHYSCMTLKSIGIVFGKDHTTVIHSLEVIDDYLATNETVRDQINKMKCAINLEQQKSA